MHHQTHHFKIFTALRLVKILPFILICHTAKAATWHRVITNNARYDITIKGGSSGNNWINCDGRYSFNGLVLKPGESRDCEIGTSQSDRQSYTIQSSSCQAAAAETVFIQAKNGLTFSFLDGREVFGATGTAWPQLKFANFYAKIETQMLGMSGGIFPISLYSYIECFFCVPTLDNPKPLSEKK